MSTQTPAAGGAAAPSYDPRRTAVLLIDPYNDFLSEGGKIWPRLKEVAQRVKLLDNLRAVTAAAREAGIRVFIAPHRQWRPGDYDDWDHPNPTQRGIQERHSFAAGTWGGEWRTDLVPPDGDDVVAKEHWAQSGFANTDLDLLLRQHGITHVIATGVLANTCVESTAKFAMELGYHVTLVRDATAAYSPELLHAAHDLSGPTFAHAILTTADLLKALRAAR
ncbi:cysteine hydrolase [Actinomadura sp. ATCC 31491]|uniref:Cysteine hydrolase n=1 Tax=Actinomadura luzonensis TaxID=2805427 RepID=A0ABT0FVB7_9ACTN|nr:cysteine hydrolase [Actinomadura luzonensis]MCK2216281.1 cysteine hydrolase [Actinomadura luzonensis]